MKKGLLKMKLSAKKQWKTNFQQQILEILRGNTKHDYYHVEGVGYWDGLQFDAAIFYVHKEFQFLNGAIKS